MDGKTTTATGTAKVKVISGSVAKNYNTDIPADGGYALYDTINGTDKVVVAFVNATDDLPNAKGVNGNYGYVVDKPFETKIDGDKVIGYTIWNGKENVTVYDKDNSAKAKKGDVITFDDLGGTNVDNVKVAENGSFKLTTAAVDGIDGNTFTVKTTNASDEEVVTTYIITDDTTVLYVDSEDVSGIEKGSLQTAADNTTTGGKTPNIKFVIDEKDGDSDNYKLDLLVIEVNNEWK